MRKISAMYQFSGGADPVHQCVVSENITADRANFRMIYEQEQKAQKELRQLSPALQEQKRNFQQLEVQTMKQLERKGE